MKQQGTLAFSKACVELLESQFDQLADTSSTSSRSTTTPTNTGTRTDTAVQLTAADRARQAEAAAMAAVLQATNITSPFSGQPSQEKKGPTVVADYFFHFGRALMSTVTADAIQSSIEVRTKTSGIGFVNV